MTIPRTRLVALPVALIALAFPAAATAEYLVPPDNSAVTQYTESLPTPAGSRDSERGEQETRTAREALGKRNARRLEREGEDGRAVAAFAAATDPGAEAGEGVADEGESEASGGAAGRGGDGNGSGATGGAAAANGGVTADQPSGSSGLSEVLGEATGTSSSGQLGLWLPLILLATAAWAVGYALRQRQQAG